MVKTKQISEAWKIQNELNQFVLESIREQKADNARVQHQIRLLGMAITSLGDALRCEKK